MLSTMLYRFSSCPEEAPLTCRGRQLCFILNMENVIQHFNLPDAYRQLLAIKAALADPELTPGRPIIASYWEEFPINIWTCKSARISGYTWTAPTLSGLWKYRLSTQMLLMLFREGLNVGNFKMKMTNFSSFGMACGVSRTATWLPRITLAWPINSHKRFWLQLTIPLEQKFSSLEEGMAYTLWLRTDKLLSNPSPANFGLGISPSRTSWIWKLVKALIAFSEDATVLVRRNYHGTEYRFFALDGQCEAVLLLKWQLMWSETASMQVRELVASKTTIPWGRDHRSPLEVPNWGHWTAHAGPAGYGPDDILLESGWLAT